VLSPDVVVEAGAEVIDSVLMNGVHVKKGARVEYAILDEMVTVSEGAPVGKPREQNHLTVIGREVSV
jgi:glucose-1-phosphate adenylyltransferase